MNGPQDRIIENIRKRQAPRVIVASSATESVPRVNALQGGVVVSNKGASAATTFALPEAEVGMRVTAIAQAAQELRLDPNGTETIALTNGVQQGAGKYITFDAIGEYVSLICITAGTWDIENFNGTVTAEA